jgi:hypothetical protein
MRIVTTHRPSLARLLCGACVCALACGGATTSLDTAIGSGTEGATTAPADEATASTGDPPPSEAPAVCAPDCTPILKTTWIWEGPSGTHALVEMLRDADGSLWLGMQRTEGGVVLQRLSAEGEPLWSAAPGLTCERCELADIALHPSGDVLITATGRSLDLAPDDALIARFDVAAREVAWVRALALMPGKGTEPRMGELVVLDEERIVAARVNGYFEGEVVELLDLTGDGELRWNEYLGSSQEGSGDWPLLLARAPTGELLLSHAWWDDLTERTVHVSARYVPPYYALMSRVELSLPLDDLAVDGTGRRFELARSDGTETITLLLTSRRSSDPERWSASLPLLTTSSTRAALAVGPDDHVYVAARTTPRAQYGQPYVVTLEVARWSTDGELRWQAARPLEVMATSDPLELVVDDEHGVIVGTVVRGRPYVARHEQTCACE